MEEISAGGVVIDGNSVLVLRKYQGDWVLPKGRLEDGEKRNEAAVREVLEETGIQGKIIKYIGYLKYTYCHSHGEKVDKTVHYYLMDRISSKDANPQKEEGFMEATFLEKNKAMDRLKHEAEKNMVKMAFELKERKH